MKEVDLLQYGYKLVVDIDLDQPHASKIYLLDDDDEETHGLGIPVIAATIAVTATSVPVLRLDIPLTKDIVDLRFRRGA